MDYKTIIVGLLALGCGFIGGCIYDNKEIKKAYIMSEKNRLLYRTAVQWLIVERKHCGITEYIERMGYKSVAVYGLSYLGKALVDQLLDNNIVIKYGIDNGTVSLKYDIPIYTLCDDLPTVDIIIVTPIYSYESIKNELSAKTQGKIVSIAEIVFKG